MIHMKVTFRIRLKEIKTHVDMKLFQLPMGWMTYQSIRWRKTPPTFLPPTRIEMSSTFCTTAEKCRSCGEPAHTETKCKLYFIYSSLVQTTKVLLTVCFQRGPLDRRMRDLFLTAYKYFCLLSIYT